MSLRKHFYLVAAKVYFTVPNDKGEVEGVGYQEVNTIVHTEKQCITVKDIGRANQAVGIQILEKLNNPAAAIENVVIFGFSYLGHMRPEEFYPKVEAVEEIDTDSIIPS